MTDRTILQTANPTYGFWGTAGLNGYDQEMTWEAASDALATAYDLTPEQIRDLLDSRFGRHLADDLSFIDGGPTEPDVIETHIMQRLAKGGWRRWFDEAVRYVRQG